MLNELAKQIHENAKSKGFYDDGKAQNIGERLALIHSEVSEALEADRKGNYCDIKQFELEMEKIFKFYSGAPDPLRELAFKDEFEKSIKNSFEDEMADIIIRVLDMCAFKNIDIEEHIRLKMTYNSLRQKLHGKKY